MLVATSSCLLGNKVRYDGSDKNHLGILQEFMPYCDFEPICPEDLAFGTPRPTIRIESGPVNRTCTLRAIVNDTGADVTEALMGAIDREIERLKELPICGIILKSRSPSCGLGSCCYYRNDEVLENQHGLLAKKLVAQFPILPIAEETTFNDPGLRRDFMLKLLACEAILNLKLNINKNKQLAEFMKKYSELIESKNTFCRAMERMAAKLDSEELQNDKV